jgi:hypothetical protein
VTIIASTQTALVHRVGLVHASTGRRISLAEPRLLPWPFGWTMRVADNNVVIGARRGAVLAGGPPVLEVVVADAVLADLLALPAVVPGQRPRSVRVLLTAADLDVPLDPVPMSLTVVLILVGTTSPSTGRSVKVRGSAGPDHSLVETAIPGTYTCAPFVWDQHYTPADLRIGTTNVRKVSVDFRTTETRIHVVDPT